VESPTVLVVEDDDDLRRLYRTALVLSGFRVVEASRVIEALRTLEGDPPDVVVLDLLLPDLDGLVVQQEIAAHARTRSIPVIIVTGSNAVLDHVDVHWVLRKPISPDRLVSVVRGCLAGGVPGASLLF
jgi:DNA-binding response OmpR family regulator